MLIFAVSFLFYFFTVKYLHFRLLFFIKRVPSLLLIVYHEIITIFESSPSFEPLHPFQINLVSSEKSSDLSFVKACLFCWDKISEPPLLQSWALRQWPTYLAVTVMLYDQVDGRAVASVLSLSLPMSNLYSMSELESGYSVSKYYSSVTPGDRASPLFRCG